MEGPTLLNLLLQQREQRERHKWWAAHLLRIVHLSSSPLILGREKAGFCKEGALWTLLPG